MLMSRGWCPLLGKLCSLPLDFLFVLSHDAIPDVFSIASLPLFYYERTIGPAFLAFTLMMCAFSLRTWRRNGVACDELLFLPGTEHGALHGVDNGGRSSHSQQQQINLRNGSSSHSLPEVADEGDAAAGGPSSLELTKQSSHDSSARSLHRKRPAEVLEQSTLSFVDSWDIDEREDEDREEDFDDADEQTEREEGDMTRPLKLTPERPSQQIRRHRSSAGMEGSSQASDDYRPDDAVQRFRESHPRITRIGSFFFFRSSTTSTQNATYAPSGPSVVGAALDLSTPICFNFHLFIDAYNHIEAYGSEAPAKILPLIFLSVLIVRTTIPPGRRGRFWSTMKFTFMAPFHRVRFRDGFVGDILTSLVRPFQDILFALSYYVTVIWGTASGKYGLSASGTLLEQSWLLHNVVLPSVALLPLWWKFLQTLRQCYDTGQRWPHLGNAFKYLTAALVVLYGMTHPEDRRSSWWLVSFALTLIYQIFWDVFVDWELIEIIPRNEETVNLERSWYAANSSHQANSYILSVRMQLFQPVKNVVRFVLTKVPRWGQIQLRSRRLYKTEAFYWRILAYNVFFRFTWMLCFIPAYRLSPSGQEHVTTFSSDTNSYVGVLLPIAEILRRTFWGFLLLEKETIEMQECDPSYAVVHRASSRDMEPLVEEDTTPDNDPDVSKSRHLPLWLGAPQHPHDGPGSPLWQILSESLVMSQGMRSKLLVAELSLWAVAFVGLGLWATA
jgi:hypothetical protein